MTSRRTANAALGLCLLLPGLAVRGQQRTVRLGWLLNTIPRSASFNVAFERRLGQLGYVGGKNLIIDDVYAEGKVERFAPLARELVARKPDVLFVSGPEAPLRALSEATHSIPIVVCAVDFDPQGSLGYSLGFEPDDIEPTIHDVLVGRVQLHRDQRRLRHRCVLHPRPRFW